MAYDTVETWNFAWCHFKEVLEVRLICSEGKNGVSRALFHPEIASESNFDLESHLVLFCDCSKAVDDVVESSEHSLLSRGMPTKSVVCIFFWPDHFQFHLILITITIHQSWPSIGDLHCNITLVQDRDGSNFSHQC